MPCYEFLCHECHQLFTVFTALDRHAEEDVTCPMCYSNDVERRYMEYYEDDREAVA
jgi:putative FmdB family regulatory protein